MRGEIKANEVAEAKAKAAESKGEDDLEIANAKAALRDSRASFRTHRRKGDRPSSPFRISPGKISREKNNTPEQNGRRRGSLSERTPALKDRRALERNDRRDAARGPNYTPDHRRPDRDRMDNGPGDSKKDSGVNDRSRKRNIAISPFLFY